MNSRLILTVLGGPRPPRANMAAWFRKGRGISSSSGAVSAWADQSGNGRHLTPATALNMPVAQSDGTILFDGTTQFLKCAAFTLTQPETVYLLAKQITWTDADYLFDGDGDNTGRLLQTGSTPQLFAGAPTAIGPVSPTLGAYAVVCAVFNGASSVVQLNRDSPVVADAGASNMGGFTLGNAGASPGFYANMQVQEVLIYSAAHDAAERSQVVSYLSRIGGLGL